MGGLIIQVITPVALTHGFRWLGQRVGPRRGALLLGLPTTTAVVLYSLGTERGAMEALGAAEASLMGLVAAALTPLVFARSSRAGWGLGGVLVTSVLAYLGIAAILGRLSGSGPAFTVGIAAIGLALAAYLASRGGDEPSTGGGIEAAVVMGRSRLGLPTLRTAIPVLMALGVRMVREVGGPSAAGLFLTFPATSLALLLTTQLESGPESARRLARALPPGALGMGAFLTTFMALTGTVGPLAGTGVGYLAALATLLATEACGSGRIAVSPLSPARFRRGMIWQRLASRRFRILVRGHGAERMTPPRLLRGERLTRRTRFSPFVEALAG